MRYWQWAAAVPGTLRDTGWIEADEPGTRFRLGVRALICGTAYLDRDPAMPYATQALEAAREQTGFTTHYARRHGDQVVYLETRESRRSVHLVSRVGRTPARGATRGGGSAWAAAVRAGRPHRPVRFPADVTM